MSSPITYNAPVSLDTRAPSLPVGRHAVRFVSAVWHESQRAAPPGVLVTVERPGANEAEGWRINKQMGVNAQYFAKDVAKLVVALLGHDIDSPAAKALGMNLPQLTIHTDEMLAGAFNGRWITVVAKEATKTDPRTGAPYVNVFVVGPASPASGPRPDAAAEQAAREATSAQPPPPPAAPAPAAFPPAGWYAHPGVPGSYYNAGGEILTEAQLRAR